MILFLTVAFVWPGVQADDALAALIGNTTRDVSDEEAYIDTDARFETENGARVLILREIYRDAKTGRKTMTDNRRIAIRAIVKIEVQSDGRYQRGDRHSYLLLVHRQDGLSVDAYGFDQQGASSMAALKTARFGLFTRETAERVKAGLEQMIQAERSP